MKKRAAAFLLCLLFLSLSATSFARDELKNTDPSRYKLYLDTSAQVLTVYERDDTGAYSRIVRRMICTSGRTQIDPSIPGDKGSPTPSGTWHIGARERFGKFASFHNEYARYWTQIVDGVYCHSIMFGARDIDTLKRSAFGHLGSTGSHGCVRLYVEDAKWLYYHACPGTVVTVGGKNQGATADDVRTDMSYKEYDAFQRRIYDEAEQPNLSAWVVAADATLRTGNGSNDAVIRPLQVGQKLEILQEGDPWVKARIDGREGYVKRAYVTYEAGVMESRPDGLILRATTFLYAAPDKSAERLCKVPHDTSLILLDQTGVPEGWTYIRYWQQEGYVQSRAITTDWATIYTNDVMPVSVTQDILGA